MIGPSKTLRLFVPFLAGLFLILACGASPQEKESKATSAPSGAAAAQKSVGFASKQKLADHYNKHGGEFGSITEAEYLKRAQLLRDRPAGGPVLEAERKDGVITRFDRETGDFIAFDRSGVIRTYFRPVDGERYFRRQLSRSH